jgi:hypothetical protein
MRYPNYFDQRIHEIQAYGSFNRSVTGYSGTPLVSKQPPP